MIHLDTSFLILALGRDSPEDRALRAWLQARIPLAMSAIGWTEFLCGPLDVAQLDLAARVVPLRIPFDEPDALLAARLFNLSGRRRGTLIDCMIAAAAIRGEAELATANPADFRRHESAGLKIAVV